MKNPIIIQDNVQGGKIVAIKPLILESEPTLPIKVNELLEPIYSSCSGNLSWIRVGDIRESSRSGKYRVIEELGTRDYCGGFKRFFKIQFLETGFVSEVANKHLKSGTIKDPYQRSVCGVGFLGEIDFRLPYFKELYNTWNKIIDRCHNPKHKRYKDYGEIGVFVSSRWHCFSNFYWDVQELKGWDNKLDDWKEFTLDKDILFASNYYSKETCVWVNKSEQSLNTTQTNYFSAISPNGNKEYFVGTYFMSDKHSLSQSAVTSCLSNKLTQTKGWANFQPIIPPQGYILRWWRY